MRPSSSSLLLLPLGALPFLSATLAVSVPQNFINTAIARTVELIGATTQVTTQYNIKSTRDGPSVYHLALERGAEPAWWEVSTGGNVLMGAKLIVWE